MPLGMGVDLGPGRIVLDGDAAPSSEKRTTAPPPPFRLMSVVATVARLRYCSALVLWLCCFFFVSAKSG